MKTIIPILLLSGMLSCTNTQIKEGKQISKQQFMELSSGLFVEKFDSLNTDENRYNADNKIYKSNTLLKYTYTIEKDGQRLFVNSFRNDWVLVNKEDTSALEPYFEAEILSGNPMAKYMPDYNQTSIRYNYPDGYNTMTGVIENTKNLWMHPPRAGIFSLMQLSGFPFVTYPIKVNNQFGWDLTSGSHYSDKRFVHWEGNIKTVSKYKVIKQEELNTAFGNLTCYVIDAESSNTLGVGYTKLYYNNKYGFVQTEFQSIDGTKITIRLIDFKLDKSSSAS